MTSFQALTVLAAIPTVMACTETNDLPTPRFEEQVVDSTISIGYGIEIGHVNNDAQPDILLADKKQFVWYRNGDWSRFVLAENLTERDNVCLAAQDIDGDGLVEIAVGAMWNPGETRDTTQSGSVHYLIRPDEITNPWEAITLHHEPTVHRMRWVRTTNDLYELVVVPLHGRNNQAGEGEGVRILSYRMNEDPRIPWTIGLVDDNMHMTHNVEVDQSTLPSLYIASKEGVRRARYVDENWVEGEILDGVTYPAGEVRLGKLSSVDFITTIEPMHGTDLVVYIGEDQPQRIVLDSTFAQGHALATGDLLNIGRDQIVAGWRNPNANEKVGIKIYIPTDDSGTLWESYIIDDNSMAAEDLKIADLNGDGKLDIIAAGRATNNLKIYWNRL